MYEFQSHVRVCTDFARSLAGTSFKAAQGAAMVAAAKEPVTGERGATKKTSGGEEAEGQHPFHDGAVE